MLSLGWGGFDRALLRQIVENLHVGTRFEDQSSWNATELLPFFPSSSPTSLTRSLPFLSSCLSVVKVKTLKHLTGVHDGSLTDDWQPPATSPSPQSPSCSRLWSAGYDVIIVQTGSVLPLSTVNPVDPIWDMHSWLRLEGILQWHHCSLHICKTLWKNSVSESDM